MPEPTELPPVPLDNHITKTGDQLAADVATLLTGVSRLQGMASGMGPDQWEDSRLVEDWSEAASCLSRAVWQMRAARTALLRHGVRP